MSLITTYGLLFISIAISISSTPISEKPRLPTGFHDERSHSITEALGLPHMSTLALSTNAIYNAIYFEVAFISKSIPSALPGVIPRAGNGDQVSLISSYSKTVAALPTVSSENAPHLVVFHDGGFIIVCPIYKSYIRNIT